MQIKKIYIFTFTLTAGCKQQQGIIMHTAEQCEAKLFMNHGYRKLTVQVVISLSSQTVFNGRKPSLHVTRYIFSYERH